MREISSLFTKEVVTVRPTETLAQAARLMDERNVGAVVVAEQQRPVGILTDRDLALALGARGISSSETVQEVMTCPVTTMSQDVGIFQATRHMMDSAQRRMPVVDSLDRLIGLVSLDDLLVLLSRELDNLAQGVQAAIATKA